MVFILEWVCLRKRRLKGTAAEAPRELDVKKKHICIMVKLCNVLMLQLFKESKKRLGGPNASNCVELSSAMIRPKLS